MKTGTTVLANKPVNKKGNFLLSQKLAPYLFVSPFVITFVLFLAYPIIDSVVMSFQHIVPGETTFVGTENYRNLLNPHFAKAISNSALYTFWTLIILIPLPLLLAVLLNSGLTPFRTFFKSALFMPALTSIIVAGAIFRLIFGDMDTALANSFLIWLGFDPIKWKLSAGPGMFLMVALASWRWMGVNILYFLSGLQNIPRELYESASIDGANALTKFWKITVPLLKPVTIYVLTISIYGGFAMFTESYVFWSNHSPANIGLTIVGYLYQQSFEFFNMGFGSAIGMTLLFIVLAVNLIQLKFFGMFGKDDES